MRMERIEVLAVLLAEAKQDVWEGQGEYLQMAEQIIQRREMVQAKEETQELMDNLIPHLMLPELAAKLEEVEARAKQIYFNEKEQSGYVKGWLSVMCSTLLAELQRKERMVALYINKANEIDAAFDKVREFLHEERFCASGHVFAPGTSDSCLICGEELYAENLLEVRI